ncbi:MAG: hypothetical protein ACYTGG_08395 [Planctomycetota bacterium]|jgi:ABC-type transport system involved in multi-copper enzyme maturation permease subunit
MIEQLLAIVRNTFYESIRQPIMLVVLVTATLLTILANPLSAFTMEDDQRMLIDIGMATVFICGVLLAAFIATNVLGREIENMTALTVVSKPVPRPLFVIGKFLGVAGAIGLGTVYMCLVFALVEEHSVLQTVREPVHVPVFVFGFGAAAIGVGAGIWCNYFYNKVFTSTVICITTPLVAIAYLLSLMFDAHFHLQPMSSAFKPQIWMGMAGVLMAVLIMTSIAVAASTRLRQLSTLLVTLGVFMLGMLSDWLFGRGLRGLEQIWTDRAAAEGLTETVTQVSTIVRTNGEIDEISRDVELATVPLRSMAEGAEWLYYAALKVSHAVVPNFQVLWLSDALTQGHVIPGSYLLRVIAYGTMYILVALGLAVLLFQRREVG